MSGTNSHISMLMPPDGDEDICPDQHICRNGAICVEYTDKEGRYMCDCDASTDSDSVYAGLSCEHVATVYCNFENRLSQTSFCTNGGTCVENNAQDGKHFGCICTDAYTGDHCEFVKIQGASYGSSSAKSASDGGASDAVKISLSVISVFALVAGFLVLFFVHRSRYAQPLSTAGNVKKNPRKASDTDLHLEADGETMNDVHAVVNGGDEEAKSNNDSSNNNSNNRHQPETSPAATTVNTAFSIDDDAESVEAGVI